MAVNTVQPKKKGVASVPVVMQLEALECGAASLAMVLAYYKKWIPLEQLRRDCGVSRDGSSALNVLRAARHFGLEANGYRLDAATLKKEALCPCILHWEDNHFVVLCGFRRGNAVINDPARGTVSVPMKDFERSFSGVCLMFSPTSDFVPGGKPHSVLRFALSRLSGTGTAMTFVILTMLIVSALDIVDPAFARVFLDRLLPGRNPDWQIPFLVLAGAFTLIRIVVSFIDAFYSLRISGKLATVSMTGFTDKLLKLPLHFYSQRMAGDILGRKESNASIASTLVDTLAPLALHFVMTLLYLVFMLRLSIPLTVLGLSGIAVNLILSQVIAKKRVNITRVQLRDIGKLSGTTVQGIEMIESIKSGGAEDGFFERWSGYQASVNAQDVRSVELNRFWGLLPDLVSSAVNLLILGTGVWLIMQGRFTEGSLLAFQSVMTSFAAPASSLISAGQKLLEMRTLMERVEDVLAYPDDPNVTGVPNYTGEGCKLTGAVEIENVSFGYDPLGEPLIRDFSLSVKPGDVIAIVGGSGSGKSTLGKLISGLECPTSGRILYDGKPIRETDRAVFCASVAVVDQDIVLFEDTVLNNIRMWDKTISQRSVIRAAKDAQIHSYILSRPGGYESLIEEGGRDLSGGQRQRMEIARVLAQDPTVLILDEATGALDAKTEFDVVSSIRARGVTCFIIAHRLSTIRDADEIIVLDHGSVVQRGTHEELIKDPSGAYALLTAGE